MLVFSRVQQWIVGASIAALLGTVGYMVIARERPSADDGFFQQAGMLEQQAGVCLTVDVGGEVVRPGLYRIPVNSRTRDAILAAGGLTSQADTSVLNLAAFLRDGDKVFVPRKAAAQTFGAVPQPPAAASTPRENVAATYPTRAPISINRASAQELEQLPGIGPVIAERIVKHRAQYGYFVRLEDLMLVSRIGPKNFEQLRPYISL